MTSTLPRTGVAAPELRRRPWTWLVETQRATDAEMAAGLLSDEHHRAERRATVVLVTAAVSLTLASFLGSGSHTQWLTGLLDRVGLHGLSSSLHDAVTTSDHARLNQLVYWATARVVAYVAIPLLVIRVVLREPVQHYGLRLRGTLRHGGPYLVLYLLMVPVVVAVSFSGSFQAKYPFYDFAPGEALAPTLMVWWPLYAAQFAALEVFFRGFMVLGLSARLGFASVYVMAVPYAMIHFNKPLPEALGAIVAGVVLGALALRYRSVWWGAALHVAIALSMDTLALAHGGHLF